MIIEFMKKRKIRFLTDMDIRDRTAASKSANSFI